MYSTTRACVENTQANSAPQHLNSDFIPESAAKSPPKAHFDAAGASDWIDYDAAEQSLFKQLNPELRLCALDHAHHFGADMVNMAAEVAQAVYPKACQILNQCGTLRVFSDQHLWDKCLKWAAWWCQKLARRYQKRPHTKYSAPSAKLGRSRSQAKRSNKASVRACLAQLYQAQGGSIRDIAKRLGLAVGTVSEATRRDVSLLWSVVCAAVQFGKDSVSPTTVFQRVSVKESLPNRTPQPEPTEPPPAKARDVDEQAVLADFLAHWKDTTGQEVPPCTTS